MRTSAGSQRRREHDDIDKFYDADGGGGGITRKKKDSILRMSTVEIENCGKPGLTKSHSVHDRSAVDSNSMDFPARVDSTRGCFSDVRSWHNSPSTGDRYNPNKEGIVNPFAQGGASTTTLTIF